MALSNNKTFELWQSFIPKLGQIKNKVGNDLYSVEVYGADYFSTFDPSKTFQKWAAVEVSDYSSVPTGLQTLTVPAGEYAVFVNIGPDENAQKLFMYIFNEWLPKSNYLLDIRPHFGLMGEKYKRGHKDSQEEIFIPIKSKS